MKITKKQLQNLILEETKALIGEEESFRDTRPKFPNISPGKLRLGKDVEGAGSLEGRVSRIELQLSAIAQRLKMDDVSSRRTRGRGRHGFGQEGTGRKPTPAVRPTTTSAGILAAVREWNPFPGHESVDLEDSEVNYQKKRLQWTLTQLEALLERAGYNGLHHGWQRYAAGGFYWLQKRFENLIAGEERELPEEHPNPRRSASPQSQGRAIQQSLERRSPTLFDDTRTEPKEAGAEP
jgi:hypothetical protein